MWRPRHAPPRPPVGPPAPSSGGFGFDHFSQPPPGPAGAFRPPSADLGPRDRPLVAIAVGSGQTIRQPYPPLHNPAVAPPGVAGGQPYPPLHNPAVAPPGVVGGQPYPPLRNPAVAPPGVAGGQPYPPPHNPAVAPPGFGGGRPPCPPPRNPSVMPPGDGGGRPCMPPRNPVVPPGVSGGRPDPPPHNPATIPPSRRRTSAGDVAASGAPAPGVNGGRGRPSDKAGDGSGAESTATELWLSAWLERSGVARRCSGHAEEKKAAKAVNLSGLQALPAAELARPETAAQLRRLVAQRRRRRRAVRRRRQADRQRVQRRHAEIDAWRADIGQRAAREKEAEEVKREADSVLGEVRRKITDVEKHLETLEELRTLREVRDLKARAAGLFSSAASDQRFAEVTARLTELLDRHLVTYEAELRALQVMTAAPPPAPPPVSGAAGPLKALKALFGARGVSVAAAAAAAAGSLKTEEPDHLLHMVDWESDPQTLLNIRSDWDRCLVGPEDPLGSSVPPSWVVPAPPSSDVWASCLAE